ncbi:Transposase [Caenorhabditis elegans]|uniref:Transposase n=1 Tax=Caenorhabditis elegans TaxID=6239 RepID=A0A4V0IIX4_CAEEL|nr:Transposase [Caenorhabditis elegans]VTW47493.1 Transposase [Caenorhabditis elegans]
MTPKLADCVNFERFTTSISDTDREVNFAGLNLFVSVKVIQSFPVPQQIAN